MMIRSIFYSRLMAALCLFFVTSSCFADNTLRMATLQAQEPLPPFIWYDSCQQKATGVIPQLLETLISDAGYRLTSVADKPPLNLQKKELQIFRFQALLNNEIDLFFSTDFYAKNPGVIIGKEPLLTLQLILLVPDTLKNLTRFDQIKSYQGSFAGVKNSQQHKKFKQYGLNVLPAASFEQQITWLKQQKTDYAIMESRIARYAIKKHLTNHTFSMSPIQLKPSKIFLYARKGSDYEKLITFSDQRLKTYRRSDLLDHIIFHQLDLWFKMDPNCSGLR